MIALLGTHAFFMALDEFYFHHKRGLGLWEAFGHPLDTLTLIICLAFLLASEVNPLNLKVYIVLSLLSSLVITKDEFVHHRECEAREQWLHAVLFVLHPIILACLGYAWWNGELSLIKLQLVLSSLFMLYQLIYWGVRPLWRK